MVEITESAQSYLRDLLDKQESDNVSIRIFITDPGTPMAETCIAYCSEGEQQSSDEKLEYDGFDGWVDDRSKPFLQDALVDYAEDRMGGQLTIKAPNSKVPKVSDDSPIEDRINYVLHSEVNPSLAEHGGMVTLVEITDHRIAVLQFGGGCQGCGMVDMTLKEGVEKSLMERIPELKGVSDVTDHSSRENAYFK
ncbi:MAG: Fe-S biogenesis protein NfuA [Candidatus Azotimanducaceae bacterium]|uniref:Fe/S biogenesis protein NfuA n=1 Tax=OM182 bacterium TaxID=2510334 RepID=A0A520S123_9GAMM|nr:Fe/S biogenesis protein NfuA [Gammaproteobacteria bacterium]OUV67896.1 MAG: Fe/S biogenesis protein NfuA [Gammaproteobacteria bacterium TMED133]RZO76173.1 MAG: Fe-S biogenesis protein NfuA [OM182 bacterium]